MAKKVLHIITMLEFGGAQANTLYTVKNLDKERFDARIISGPGGILDPQSPATTVYAARLGRSIRPCKDLAALFELYTLIKKESPDIVHTHSSKAGILGRLAARLANVPVIIHTFHGFGFHERQNPLKKYLFIVLEKICASISDALIFVSRANMDYARTYSIGDDRKYSLIRSGIALEKYPAKIDRAAKRAELGIPENAVVVASIGNFKPQKNTGHFISAAQELAPQFPEAVFLLAGGGEELEAARQEVKRLGLEKRCILPGWRDDSAQILAASDIFVMTSLWEGLPRSLVEAMKTGLPSLCYRTDGVADLIRDGVNGFIVDQNDLKTFCARLKELLSNRDLRARMSTAAATSDLGEFDINLMVRQQETLYTDLLTKKGINA